MTPKLQQALRYISSEAGKREVNAFIRMHNRNRSKFRIIYEFWDVLVYRVSYFWKFKLKSLSCKLRPIK